MMRCVFNVLARLPGTLTGRLPSDLPGRLPGGLPGAAYLFLMLAASLASAQTVYYVRTTGDDTNSGLSADQAFATVSRSSAFANPGDVVYIGAGTYEESFTPSRSGTASEPIRFVGDVAGTHTGDVGEVILTNSGSSRTVLFQGRSYLRLEHLIIDAGDRGNAVEASNTTTDVRLLHCTIRNAGGHLVIATSTASSLRLDDCVLTDATGSGVHASAGTVTLQRVTIHDVGDKGVFAQNRTAAILGHRVVIGRAGGNAAAAQSGSISLLDSVIHGSGMNGVTAQNGTSAVWLYNTVVADSAQSAVVANNGTVSATNTIFSGSESDLLRNLTGEITLTACILDQTGGGGLTSGTVSQSNVSTGDAGMTDAAGDDFTLRSSSAAIDAGEDIASIYAAFGFAGVDLLGATRPTNGATDIGAHEYTGAFAASVPYAEDFVGDPGNEWSDDRIANTATTGRYLGRFGMENGNPISEAVLRLATVPGESYLVTFDLILLETWDGIGRYTDYFRIDIDGERVLDHTFSPNGRNQSYPKMPDLYGRNLGYERWNDTVFRDITVEFTASEAVTEVAFNGYSTGGLAGENWGIDNVTVQEIGTIAADLPYFNTFDSVPGYEWVPRTVQSTGSDIGNVLGPFTDATARLAINTTPGTTYTLYFDLYAFDGWNADTFTIAVDGTEVVRDTLRASRPGPFNGQSAQIASDLAFGTALDLGYEWVRVTFTAANAVTTLSFSSDLEDDPSAAASASGQPTWGLGRVIVTDTDRLPGLLTSWVYAPSSTPNTVHVFDWTNPFRESIETQIDFLDTRGSFYTGGPTEKWGMWLRGTIEIPESGDWTFGLKSDDGSRLWIDGVEIINNDGRHAPRTRSATVAMQAGFYPIEVKWYEWTGQANLELFWDGPGSDGYELVPARYFSRPLPSFVDVSAGTGFGVTTASSERDDAAAPLLFGDFDNDGRVDAFVGGDHASLLLNRAGENFERFRLSGSRQAYNGAGLFDADRDGDLDLWSVRGASTGDERLWLNDGLGNLSDMGSAGFSGPSGNQGLAMGDLNSDGWTDLVMLSQSGTSIGHHTRVVDPDDGPVFEEDTERFDDLTSAASNGRQTYSATGDLNDDGVPDAFSVRGGGSVYLSNFNADDNNDGTIDDDAHTLASMGITLPSSIDRGVSVDLIDYDNDGDLDLWVGSRSSASGTLWRREASGFVNVTTAAGLAGTANSRASAWGDFDNDGYLDLFVSIKGGADQMYRGTGSGFALIDEPLLASTDYADNAVFVDIDNDLDLDLAVLRPGGMNALFENLRDDRSGLLVEVVGNGLVATDAIGTKVELFDALGTRLGRRDVGTATGAGGQASLRMHFGVPDPGAAYTVLVTWPGGRQSEHNVVPATTQTTIGPTTITGLVRIVDDARGRVRMVRWREMSPEGLDD